MCQAHKDLGEHLYDDKQLEPPSKLR
jgi:hypothetical protein